MINFNSFVSTTQVTAVDRNLFPTFALTGESY